MTVGNDEMESAEAVGSGRRRGTRRLRRNDEGAVLVEAAIVMPLLLLVVFGILEYGLVFRTSLSVSESTRAGARVAVAQPRVEGYQTSGAAAVSGALAASRIPGEDIELLVIYKADPATGRMVGGGDPETCAVECWQFVWDDATREFREVDGPRWDADSQSACGSESQTDYLGVYVRANYTFVTGFFGESMTLTERSVMRLEPLPLTDTCAPAG